MLSPRKHLQHPRRILRVTRLLQDLLIHHDDRVCAEYDMLRPLAKYSLRFLASEPLRIDFWVFTLSWNFRYVRRLHHEFDSCVAQEFLSAWRGGSQDQHGCRF